MSKLASNALAAGGAAVVVAGAAVSTSVVVGVSVTAVEPGDGAAVVVDDQAWVLIDGAAQRSLGGALAWALRRDATSLQLIADVDTGVLARRAGRFAYPIEVWYADDRTLLPAVAEPRRGRVPGRGPPVSLDRRQFWVNGFEDPRTSSQITSLGKNPEQTRVQRSSLDEKNPARLPASNPNNRRRQAGSRHN